MRKVTRRRFFEEGTLACAGSAALALGLCTQCGGQKAGVELKLKPLKENGLSRETVVARGDNPAEITEAALAALGGLEKLVTPGDVVIVKPNIAFDRTPEQAANTNPQVVATIVKLAVKAGASEVHVFDHALNDARLTYKSSGIGEAAERAGARVSYVRGKNDPRFKEFSIPNGVAMNRWPLHDMLAKATVLINVPIAKHHNVTRLSLGLKNLMGLAGGDRGTWHPDIAKRLAELSSAVKVDLTVIDAFRILVDHGPTGGSLDDVKETHQVIASVDPVAVDSYAATLFGIKGEEIGYIQEAYDRGLGEMNLSKVTLKEVTV